MAVQKNFVVKNGIEVNDNLIFADKDKNTVGIGTTITPEKLQVNGGIGATSLVVTGIATIPTLKSTDAFASNGYINVGVVTSITGTGLTYTTGNFGIVNANNVNAVSGVVTNLSGTISTYTDAYSTTSHTTTLNATNAYVTTGVVTSITGAQLNYTDGTITDLTSTRINNSGIATVGSLSIGSTQVLSSAQQLQNILSLDATTTATIGAAITTAPLTFANILVAGISTLGTVKVASGIITATSGVVTYYGDGRYLDLTANPSRGIGIGTTGGVVGYGITFLDLKGAGVSTSIYNSSVGIATIFFQGGGGGGGGAIGIGSTFPGTPLSLLSAPSNGDLFYHIDYGRTFIYYDEVILGVGSSAFWVDAAPFNVGVNPTLAGVAFSMGTANNPSAYFEGYTNTGWFSPTAGQFGIVSVGNTILTANPSGIVVTGIASATTFSGNFSGGTAVFADTTSGDLVRITQAGTGNALIVEDQTNPDASPFVITGIGSVGIQTNAPSANFDVFGGMKISRQDAAFDGGEITFARASDNVNAWSLDVYGSNANTSFRITDVINSQPRIHIGSGGNVGLGSTATSKLHVFGDAIITGIVTATFAAGSASAPSINPTGDNNTGIFFPTADTLAFAEGGAESARFNSSGNILVGTTSDTGTASQRLQVTGNAYVSTSIGIGTTNPNGIGGQTSQLAMAGANTGGGAGYHQFLTVSNTAATNPNKFFRLNSTGTIEIVNSAYTTVLFSFTNAGDFTATGNVTGYSDETLKDNIQTIPDALDKVVQLRGVEFDRKDIEGSPHQIGVIAQEVEKVIPEVVMTHEDGIKSVAYGNLVGLLIEAVKDLKEEVNELKARLEEV